MPSTRLDLTQGLIYRVELVGRGREHASARALVDSTVHRITRCNMNFWSLSILCLVTLLVVDSPDSEILWNVNLCLSLIFHSARMLDRPTEAGNPKSKFLMQVSPNLSQLRKLQTASSRIWTRVIVSISNDANHYSHAHTHTQRHFFLSLLPLFSFFFFLIYYISWRPGFNPRSCHTKDSKNNTWCCFAYHSAL